MSLKATATNDEAVRKLQGVAREIRAMGHRVDDISPVGPRIGALLSSAVRRQFTTKGAYLGTPWRALSARTIADKVAKGLPAPSPLVRSGALKVSFIGRPMRIEKYGKDSLTYGSDLKRAMWQQKGTHRNGKRHIPPRVMLKIGREQRSQISDIIEKYVAKGKVI